MHRLILYPASIFILLIGATASAEEMKTMQAGLSTAYANRGLSEVSEVRWVGFAISPKGRVFKNDGQDESRAKQNAKNECEQNAGSTCQSIAVPSSWDVSAITCDGGSFVAGSNMGFAQERAKQKATNSGFDRSLCDEVYRY